jgi:hypothetical protein
VSKRPVFYIPNGPPGEEYAVLGDQPPGVVLFFRLYTGALAVLGVGLVALGFALIGAAPAGAPKVDELVNAVFYVVLGATTSATHAIALFGGRRAWVHTFGLVLIGFGTLSCCCLPITLPLLLAWNKSDVKKWYTPAPVRDDDEP